MIKERYVSFQVATLLRNKGFNELCRGVYEEKILRINTLCDWFNSDFSEYVAAPTQTMACDWIEETFNIAIVLDLTSIACYCKVTYDVKLKMKGVTTSLHDAFWHCIEVFAKEAQQGKH